MHYRKTWFTFALLALAGCADERSTPLSPSTESMPLTSASSAGTANRAEVDAAGQKVAQAFALAMADANVRVMVRNSLRASPFNEHKLVLQEFLATRDGERLLAAAAKASGLEVNVLTALVAQLPSMDFYAPVREHRLAWKGSEDVVVGFTVDQDNPLLTSFYTRRC